jgi:energy-converting hydrogenase Eha subunit B
VVAPLAVRVVFVPEQIVVDVGVTETLIAPTVTVLVAVAEHPPEFETVTM